MRHTRAGLKLPKENRDKREYQSKTGSDIKHEMLRVCVCVCVWVTMTESTHKCIEIHTEIEKSTHKCRNIFVKLFLVVIFFVSIYIH